MQIKQVPFSDLNKCEGCTDEFNIILYNKPSIIYYGLFVNSDIVSVMAVENKNGTHYKFRANYTPKRFRRRGYGITLLENISNIFNDKPVVAEANDWSVSMYLKTGFKVTATRKCKYWTKYFMRKEAVQK